MDGPRARRWAAALVFSAALLAHGGGVRNGYAWDDVALLVQDASLRSAASLPRILTSMDEVPGYYRPLTRGSFVLDGAVLGMSPRASHAVEVLLHASAALLLFLLALRLGLTTPGALAAGLLLAVHPVHVEAVALVVARNNLLVLLFGLLSTLALLRALERRSLAWGWASALCTLLAILSKEPGVMLLPLLGWLAFDRLRRTADSRSLPRDWLALAAPQALALFLAAGLRWSSLGALGAPGSPASSPPASLGERLALSARLLVADAGLLAWPRGLTIFHQAPTTSLPLTLALCAALLCAGLLAFWRGGAAVRFGSLLAALQWVPVSGLVSTSSAPLAERYLYLPGAGVWLCAGAAVSALASWASTRRPSLPWPVPLSISLTAAGVALLLGLATGARTGEWRDDRTLAGSALALDPRSLPALRNLASFAKDRGELGEATRLWTRAVELAPGDADALGQLGTVAAMAGDFAGAEARYRRALESPEAAALIHFNLGRVCELTGRPAEAAVQYRSYLARAQPAYGGRALVPEAVRRLERLGEGGGAVAAHQE